MPGYVGYGQDIAHGGYGIQGVGRKRGAKTSRYKRMTKKAGGTGYPTRKTPGSKRYDPGTTKAGLKKYKRS